MKKALLIFGVLAALIACAIALAFVPGVQRWALKRALPGAEVERVSAGMSAAEVRGLTLVQDGARITVPAASAEYSAWSYLTGGGIQLASINAKGVVVDLRDYAPPAPATPAARGFEGILGGIALPVGLRLDAANIAAEVILPSPGSPDGKRVKLAVDGGGVGADREATFNYRVSFSDPTEGAAVPSAAMDGRLVMKVREDGTIEALSLQASQLDVPEDRRLQLSLEFGLNEARRETCTIEVVVPAVGDSSRQHRLVRIDGALDPARGWVCTWSASVDDALLAPLIDRSAVPAFTVAGEGGFTHEIATGKSTASGDVKASLANLERALPDMAHLGRITVDAAFTISIGADRIELLPSLLKVSTERAADILAVETMQDLEFDTATGRLGFKEPDKDLATVAFNALPIGWFMPVAGSLRLEGGAMSGAFVVQADPTGAQVGVRASRPLTVESLTVSDAARKVLDRGTFSTSLQLLYTPAKIETVADSWTLTTPAGDRLEGSVHASYVPGMKIAAEFRSTMRGTLASLLKPFSPIDVGTVTVDSAFEGSLDGDVLTVRAAQADIKNAAGAALLSQRLHQPLRFDMESLSASTANPATPAVSLAFGSVPLGWVEPFVEGGTFGGVVESGAIDLTLANEGPAVATTRPVVIRGASVTLDKKPLVERLDIAWDGTAAMKGSAMSANVRALDVRQGTVQLLTLKGTLESNGETDLALLRATARGTLDANIGALLGQPAAAEWRVLEAGRVTAEFDVAAAESIKVLLKADAKGLVATQDRKPLGDATVSVDASVNIGKDGEFKVPLTVVNSGRRSDVSLTGNFTQQGEKITVNARVSGETIHLDDVSALAAFAPSDGAATPAAPAGPRNTTRDEKPFWSGADGTFDIDIKNLVGATDKPITSLKARAVMTPDRVALENFSGAASGGQMAASGALRFIAADREPYVLDAKFRVPGLDMATFFAAEAPGKPPTLETVVVAEGTATGRGLNLDDLLARVQGRMDVTGGKGVYRGLARSSDMVSTGAGLVGALFGGQKVQDATQAVSELATQLREMRFDEMKLKVARGADLKLNIETLELLSPTMRLSGKGVVNMDPDLPLVRQAQRLEMRIGFKDALGERMIARRMTDGTVDDLGYARFRVPILLSGNLLSPDSKQFWEAVTRSMMEMGVQSFMGGG